MPRQDRRRRIVIKTEMENKERKQLNMKKQWAKCIIVTALYLAFLLWVKSWWGLIVVPFIFDVYITKKIRWQWWKNSEPPVRFIMSWVDAIVFALVAVYFINLFFFQNYVIPSSSLEKSLLTGDYLFVSKVSYGPRIPETPLTMPLTQHTLPVLGCKSYLEWPQWDYRRVKGFGNVELNDIVVFNYPSGDTLVSNEQYQAADFYMMCYSFGSQLLQTQPDLSAMTPQQQYDWYRKVYNTGREYIVDNSGTYGKITTRPVDRRENYVKRCVGLPGQTLQIKNRIIYLNGKPNKEPDNVQYTYYVKLLQPIPDDLMKELGISMEDLTSLNQNGYIPLTNRAVKALGGRKDIVQSITLNTDLDARQLRPRMDSEEGRDGQARHEEHSRLRTPHPRLRGQRPPGARRKDLHQRQADRPVHVQDGLLLDDGRQPPQLRRQPLLGLRA